MYSWADNKIKLNRALVQARREQNTSEERLKAIYSSFGGKLLTNEITMEPETNIEQEVVETPEISETIIEETENAG